MESRHEGLCLCMLVTSLLRDPPTSRSLNMVYLEYSIVIKNTFKATPMKSEFVDTQTDLHICCPHILYDHV